MNFMNILLILFILTFAVMAVVLIAKTTIEIKKINKNRREQLKRQYGLEKFAQKE